MTPTMGFGLVILGLLLMEISWKMIDVGCKIARVKACYGAPAI